jgi:hypothetical protein
MSHSPALKKEDFDVSILIKNLRAATFLEAGLLRRMPNRENHAYFQEVTLS